MLCIMLIQNLQYPVYNHDIDQRLLRLTYHVRNNWCPPFYASLSDFHEWLNIFGMNLMEDIFQHLSFILRHLHVYKNLLKDFSDNG